ncbi:MULTISPECIES: DUF6603 domain-containing protein [Streptomyces]|uniref:DUF6603 domain-containing protein n=1 Tax=Streptomyces TaxID=1883 RepID=UPI00345B9054
MNDTETATGKARLLLCKLDLNDMKFRIPLIDSIMPSGVEIGLNSFEIGYSSAPLGAADMGKVKNLATDFTFPPGGLNKGPFLLVDVFAAGLNPGPLYSPLQQGSSAESGTTGTTGADLDLAPSGTGAPPAGSPTAVWWDVNRSAGPVHLGRVGAGYQSGRVLLLADAEVEGGGFRLGTKGLGCEVPVKDPGHPGFRLDGLSLSFNRPPLTIAGEFVRQNRPGYKLAVGGMAVIGTPALSVTALGFYAQRDSGDPSLFIFGMLDLGKKSVGPPMFRLKKLAAGFGYNSQVRTPAISEVTAFPFVAMLGQQSAQHPLAVLDNLVGGSRAWVTPAAGQTWLAAGLEAVIYELVDVSAVGIVQFGNDFSVGLYGRALASFPPQSGQPIAKLAVDLRAEYRGSADTLEIDALIANGSYVLDPRCRLTGGAAVRLWFGRSQHPGDFVVTMGGYHPKFHAPSHYPVPPRLGFEWDLPHNNIYISGGCYAALTPHAFMAGFNAQMHGEWGPVEVDANVYANALIEWDPLYFDVEWGGRIRGRVAFLSGEVKADGAVWGPPVGGSARVEICGYGITVKFGHAHRSEDSALPAAKFREQLLPAGNDKVVHVVPTGGLVPGSQTAPGGAWALDSNALAFSVGTAVPLTSVTVNGTDAAGDKQLKQQLCIRPMQKFTATSALSVTVSSVQGNTRVPVVAAGGKAQATGDSWLADVDRRGVPAALWGAKDTRKENSDLIPGHATAVMVKAPNPAHDSDTCITEDAWTVSHTAISVPSESAPTRYWQSRKPIQAGDLQNALGASQKQRTDTVSEILRLSIPGCSYKATEIDVALNKFRSGVSSYLDADPQTTGA